MKYWRIVLLMTAALLQLQLAAAVAGPNGASVVAGSVAVQGQGTASVVVNQTSQNAIINWNTFNIGAGESTSITMPNSTSAELDRVTGGLGPSQILGSLISNGRVFLVNPDGILFGQGAQVNVGSLLATTHDIANSDFMAGRYNFSISGNPSASVVNEGTITAQSGGFAALVAPGVRNTGTITATLGQIGLASANSFSLDLYGDELIELNVGDSIASKVIDVSTGLSLKSLVSNAGLLAADGGRVALTAVAARQVVDSVINNSGVIEANSIGSHNGMIVLSAGTGKSKPAGAPTQTVKVSGTLSASGQNAGESGGTIEVTAENVELAGATVDASGTAGGGAVLIGGDWGGGNPNTSLVSNQSAFLEPFSVPNATTVSVDAATIINASATAAGNGGKVIVWSDGATTFNGTIAAEGGAQAGDGGFVETSGHQLSIAGTVETGAPAGKAGAWLLDPLNATIDTNAGPEVITVSSIENALSSGDVVVTTVGTTGTEAGDITVASSLSWASANTLTLNAYRNITVDDGVTIANTGAGSLVLRADATGTGVGTVNFLGSGKIDFSNSTGTVSIFYNPADNPAGSMVNTTSYVTPFDYGPYVVTNIHASDSRTPFTDNGQFKSYMLVNSINDLQNIENNLSANYALGTDIDATATVNWNNGAGFKPIGSPNTFAVLPWLTQFTGILDGENRAIKNLTINTTASGYIGLFTVNWGEIQDVTLSNASITGENASIGSLVGLNVGFVLDSHASGLVTDTMTGGSTIGGLVSINGLSPYNALNQGVIETSSSSAIVTGNGTDVLGGLVGWNSGAITHSSASGSISGYSWANGLGGLVGLNEGSIQGSYATGAVTHFATLLSVSQPDIQTWAGGLVGSNGGSILNSYSTGQVSLQIPAGGEIDFVDVGGLVGENAGGSIMSSYTLSSVNFLGSVIYSPVSFSGFGVGAAVGLDDGPGPGKFNAVYWDSDASGQSASAGGNPLTTAQLKTGLPIGFDATVWGSNPSINNGYPYLLWTQASPPPAPTIFVPVQTQIITVDANPETKIYGNLDPILTYTVVSGNLGSATFSGSLTRVAGENVGSYPIEEGTLSLPSNYQIDFVDSALSITPRPITVTANPQTMSYGSVVPPLTYAVGGLGLVDGDTLTGVLATTATSASNVGQYAITQGTLAASQNYALTYQPGILTIDPAALTVVITAADQSKVYGTVLDLGTSAFTVDGTLYNGDTVNSVTLTSAGAAASASVAGGPYPIVPSKAQGTGLGNYAITYVDGTLTVDPATLTYFANPISRQYGTTNPLLTGKVTGFVNGDTLASATTGKLSFAPLATTDSNVGSYAVDGSGLTANLGNYVFVQAPSNATALTINPAPLTITANDESKTYGTTFVLGTTAFTVDGTLYNGDTVNSVTLTSAGAGASASLAGSPYAIIPSNAQGIGLGLGNYSLAYVNGELTLIAPPSLQSGQSQFTQLSACDWVCSLGEDVAPVFEWLRNVTQSNNAGNTLQNQTNALPPSPAANAVPTSDYVSFLLEQLVPGVDDILNLSIGQVADIMATSGDVAQVIVGLAEDAKLEIKNQLPVAIDYYADELSSKPLSAVIYDVNHSITFYAPIPTSVVKALLLDDALKQNIEVLDVDE